MNTFFPKAVGLTLALDNVFGYRLIMLFRKSRTSRPVKISYPGTIGYRGKWKVNERKWGDISP
jgi:hypothetical protein